jgi:hypothetical protein
MSEVLNFLTQHTFLSGLIVGLVITVIVWIRGILSQRSLRKEIINLKESLYARVQIETKGHMTREGEIESLKKQNENLRITVGSLQQKPGRSEIRQLHVYDKAIHSMLARAPGFAPTWEIVIKEAEEEVQKTETGVAAFFRRVFVPQQPLPRTGEEQKLIETEEKKD